MHQILMSSVIILASMASASASDRYPTTKRYVNQTGEIVATRQLPLSYTIVPREHVLPALRVVPVVYVPIRLNHVVRTVAIENVYHRSTYGAVNENPEDWPSGRTCCRPGQTYFNENPDS